MVAAFRVVCSEEWHGSDYGVLTLRGRHGIEVINGRCADQAIDRGGTGSLSREDMASGALTDITGKTIRKACSPFVVVPVLSDGVVAFGGGCGVEMVAVRWIVEAVDRRGIGLLRCKNVACDPFAEIAVLQNCVLTFRLRSGVEMVARPGIVQPKERHCGGDGLRKDEEAGAFKAVTRSDESVIAFTGGGGVEVIAITAVEHPVELDGGRMNGGIMLDGRSGVEVVVEHQREGVVAWNVVLRSGEEAAEETGEGPECARLAG